MTGQHARRAKTRVEAAQIVRDTHWPGTEDLTGILLQDSVGRQVWRASRAAIIHGCVRRPWMTPAEFDRWIVDQNAVRRARIRRTKATDEPTIFEAIGMNSSGGRSRKSTLLRGVQPFTLVEALACAHYAQGLPLPVQPGDVGGFAAWFEERFHGGAGITDWLGVNHNHVSDRCRGFSLRDGRRVDRAPEIDIIRALDWVWRFGPFCPYGEPAGIDVTGSAGLKPEANDDDDD